MFLQQNGTYQSIVEQLEIFWPKKELWENDDEPSPRKRMRTPLHSDMERALYLWFSNARANNIPVTDSILKEKAQRFGGD